MLFRHLYFLPVNIIIVFMLKRILTLFTIIVLTQICYGNSPKLRDYNEYQIPAGYHIPILSLQEFSTAYTEEGEQLNFITTNDIFLFNKKIIPQGTKLTGYIEKKNEPIRGTNAAMIVFINKMYLPDGFEIPIKAYISTVNDNKIGGELTAPETYNKIPHYQRWTMFRAFGILQYVPGAQRKMGEHVTISSGANLKMVIVEPINMTHTVIN